MRIYQCADYSSMSRKAASIIAAQIQLKPDCVLGLATGSTPVGAYEQLVRWYQDGELSFAEVKTANLDEYYGLAPEHDQSYRYFMQKNLFDHVDIKAENTHVPNGLAGDPEKAGAGYDHMIRALGGIDLQLLGLGQNGHIGFNEPADCYPVGTHLVDLTASTIEANKRFFASEADVPRQALTMGIGTIMNARSILLVVNGAAKADIVRAAFQGPVVPQVPASVLQLHPNVVLVGDRGALSKLDLEKTELK